MFDAMLWLGELLLPVFIYATMANVGMTQDPLRIVEYWKDWPFYLKMLLANFVAAPLIVYLLLQVWPLAPQFEAALLVFSVCAGAPFLIKLTQVSEHDLALGAATMMLLVVATIVVAPIALPNLVIGLVVDASAIAWMLALQLLAPMVVGGLAAHFLPELTRRVQPWIARIGNIALYLVMGATIIGYAPQMLPIIMSGALIFGLVFVVAAFGAGYLAGKGKDSLEDIGALGTAQRNTAAAMLIATSSFTDPSVFVLITLVNTIGIAVLIGMAKLLKGDNARFQAL